jgi:hypothetical protein
MARGKPVDSPTRLHETSDFLQNQDCGIYLLAEPPAAPGRQSEGTVAVWKGLDRLKGKSAILACGIVQEE